MQTSACNLCTITTGIIARGELWTMALNANQALLGRCYFALNRHSVDALSLTDDETLALYEWFRRSRTALDSLLKPDHYNFVTLMNVEPHVHGHIIPRYKGAREFGGQTFNDSKFGANFNGEAEQYLESAAYEDLVAQIAGLLPQSRGRS
jgi:diadenosine tetraphosphate (Ap4A) HIT family hydrolase